MAIHYGCVAVGRSIIADYAQEKGANFRAVVLSMLPNIATQQVRKIFTHTRYKFAVLPENGILYICATSPDFSEEEGFSFLEEVVKSFNCENNNEPNDDDDINGQDRTRDVENGGSSNTNEDVVVTVVDGLGVKKIRKFPGALKKKMKTLSKGKPTKMSLKIRIPGRKKKKHKTQLPPFVTPSNEDKYVALVEDEVHDPHDPEDYTRVEESANAYIPINAHSHSIGALRREVEEVQGIVREGLEKVLTRGENLEDLLVRADNLESTAYQFKQTTKHLKRKMKRRHRRLICGVVVGTTVATVVVVLVVVFVVL